jgi:hypothetical protein
MEPTRKAWVPLAAWFRRRGATVIMVLPEQSADLRDYYSKRVKVLGLTVDRPLGGPLAATRSRTLRPYSGAYAENRGNIS